MALVGQVWLMYSIAFVSVCHSRGLEFTIARTPGNQICGRLRCHVNTDQSDQSIFSIVDMTIYEVVQTTAKSKVASMSASTSVPELFVNPMRGDVTNVSGSVSRYHVDLSLELMEASDCLNATFQCELDFMNLSGQLDSQKQMLAPEKSNSSASSCDISSTFNELNDRADQIKNEIDRLNKMNDDLEAKLDSLLGNHHDTSAPTPTNGPVTPQTPAITACTTGMLHVKPRETFILQDNILALCDTETDGGGWIIIQRRTKGDVNFYRDWSDYKNGFGTPDTDLWLGNDVIHNLTSQGYTQLRVDLEHQGSQVYATFSTFTVGDESSHYKLTVSGYSGTAGDSMSYHSGMGFTTFDQDNDEEIYYNCGDIFRGAWWHRDCFESNLNGEWGKDSFIGMIWNKFVPECCSEDGCRTERCKYRSQAVN